MKMLLFLFLAVFMASHPSFAGFIVSGDLLQQKTIRPGEPFEGTIVLHNTGNAPFDVKASRSDYRFFADGRAEYGEPGSSPRSNANWLAVSPARLTIPPKSSAFVYYKGKAPVTPELRGSYWSVVMIEPAEAVSADPQEKGKLTLRTVIRYAVNIATEIGDSGSRDIRFLDKKMVMKDGKRLFQLGVENSGERRLFPLVTVDLFNAEGSYAGRFESGKSNLYPGCSTSFSVDLTTVPKGSYSAVVAVDNGDDAVFGAKYKLVLE